MIFTFENRDVLKVIFKKLNAKDIAYALSACKELWDKRKYFLSEFKIRSYLVERDLLKSLLYTKVNCKTLKYPGSYDWLLYYPRKGELDPSTVFECNEEFSGVQKALCMAIVHNTTYASYEEKVTNGYISHSCDVLHYIEFEDDVEEFTVSFNRLTIRYKITDKRKFINIFVMLIPYCEVKIYPPKFNTNCFILDPARVEIKTLSGGGILTIPSHDKTLVYSGGSVMDYFENDIKK